MRLAWVKCEAPQKDVVHFCPVLALLSTFVHFCPVLSTFVRICPGQNSQSITGTSQEGQRRVKGGSKEDQRRIKGGSKEGQRRIKAASKEDQSSIKGGSPEHSPECHPDSQRIATAGIRIAMTVLTFRKPWLHLFSGYSLWLNGRCGKGKRQIPYSDILHQGTGAALPRFAKNLAAVY